MPYVGRKKQKMEERGESKKNLRNTLQNVAAANYRQRTTETYYMALKGKCLITHRNVCLRRQ